LTSSQDSDNHRRVFVLPNRGTLPREAIERIRGRDVRARVQSLAKWAGPFKVVLFLVILFGLSYLAVIQLKELFFSTSYFELKKIEVEGLKTLDKDEVVKLAGVAPSMNILNIDRDSIRARLLLHPTIKTAAVHLDGLYTLKLTIEERKSMMYLKTAHSFLEIADDGTVLSIVGLTEKDLPIITGIDPGEKRIGDSLESCDEFHEARLWVTGLTPKHLQGISEINFSNSQNPYLFLLSGVKIFPKDLPDFQNRYLFLCALLDNLRKNKVEPEYLDLRAPHEIVIKPKRIKRSMEGRDLHIDGG